MKAIWDFVRAAAPWVAMGLAVAILAVRGTKQKKATEKQDKKQAGNYGTEGMCLGMCLGTALGSTLWNDTGIGLSLGMLIGLAIGSGIRKDQEDSDK
ncbi:MAG: hypothetical protein Q4C31_05490 [Eubacteriales bacterium]|nr:hypothetical protein [Eubacteriales bacterium]